MKKLLLASIMTVGLSLSAFSQFVFTTTSVEYTGDGDPGFGNGAYYSYQPGYNNDPTNPYLDNACVTPLSNDPSQMGGWDPSTFDANTATPARHGTIFYGGGIRTVYSCGPNNSYSPSFGASWGSSVIDLTDVANQKIQFTYQSNSGNGDLDVEIQLMDVVFYNGKLNSMPFTFISDGAPHTETIDFSTFINGTPDMTDVGQLSFVYPANTKSPDIGISIADLRIGSSVVSSINDSKSSISSSKLYPNPATDLAKVELELKAVSNVKVTLSDLMGKEIMTVTEGAMSSVKADINTADLNKGIYTVNYVINGAVAKAELLMVK